jgi:glycosyltransferase involved in cell wall biosynthesis
VGGSCGPADDLFVAGLRDKLQAEGLQEDVDFARNVTHDSKIDFLKSISVFSVPARYGEAFGLYLIEALAAGVPVVQPRCASFPELVEATGGGLLFEPDNPESLAMAAEQLLIDSQKAHGLGEVGRKAVRAHFSSEAMAQTVLKFYQKVRTADLVEKV